MLNWKDIPQRTRDGNYAVDVPWSDLEDSIERYNRYGLVMCPDFQRGHVWTMAQRVAYVESKLSGGVPVDIIRLNQSGWMTDFKGELVCVDGLQRLTTALMFLRDEIPVFGGHVRSQIAGGRMPNEITFRLQINNLPTRAAVLTWYLERNGAGTPHSPEELARVAALRQAEIA